MPALKKWSSTTDWQTWLPNGLPIESERVVIEVRDSSGDINSDQYIELSGIFLNSTDKASLSGLSGSGSRFTPNSNDATTISSVEHKYKIIPTLSVLSGNYRLDVAMAADAVNASTAIIADILQSGCENLPSSTIRFQKISPSTWGFVGNMQLDFGEFTPEITFEADPQYLRGILLNGIGRFYADSFRFTSIGPDTLRINDTGVRLPYNKISNLIVNDGADPGIEYQSATILPSSGTIIARYRFGQFYSSGESTSLLNRMSIGTASELTQRFTHASAVSAQSEVTDLGFLSPSRDSYAVIDQDSLFAYPSTNKRFYIGCWIKSITTDYSGGIGYIAICQSSDETILYAIYIDTDNTIKATINGSPDPIVLDSDISIDQEWHNIMLVSSAPGSSATHYLIIDNAIVAQTDAISVNSSGLPNIEFSLGSSEYDSSLGFVGYIDELVLSEWTDTFFVPVSYRFSSQIIYSTVIDSEQTDGVLSSVIATYDVPNNSSISLSFRASNDTFSESNVDPSWSSFTASGVITSGSEISPESFGLNIKGRYHQIRVLLRPSDDDLQVDTPVLKSLEVVFGSESRIVGLATTAFADKTIIGQSYDFDGNKTIDKVSINLISIREKPIDIITGQSNVVSFHAANFNNSRDSQIFQPITNTWETSRISIENTFQDDDYEDSEIAAIDAPFLQYDLVFAEEGVYDLWGYGATGSFFFAFDSDTTNMSTALLGQSGVPEWTKFGKFEVEAGSLHTFRVYLYENKQIIFDQWLFTSNRNFENDIESAFLPVPVSPCPYNTALRLRPVGSTSVNDNTGAITVWKPSSEIFASGKFNYIIDGGKQFTDGLIIDFWQIGGSSKHCAAWNYNNTDISIGSAFVLKDFGQATIVVQTDTVDNTPRTVLFVQSVDDGNNAIWTFSGTIVLLSNDASGLVIGCEAVEIISQPTPASLKVGSYSCGVLAEDNWSILVQPSGILTPIKFIQVGLVI